MKPPSECVVVKHRAVGSILVVFLVVAAVACQAPRAAAAAPQPPLAAVRAEVEAALRLEAAAVGFPERAAATRRLVAVHDTLAGDPRFAASAAATGLRRRVAARLVVVRDRLRPLAGEPAGPDIYPASEPSADRTASTTPSAAGAAGGRQAEAQLLIDLIEATIHPEVWEAQGGPCRIRYFPNGQGIVVRATQEVHEDLGLLLRQLRAAGYD